MAVLPNASCATTVRELVPHAATEDGPETASFVTGLYFHETLTDPLAVTLTDTEEPEEYAPPFTDSRTLNPVGTLEMTE